jgi:hypothetical protein
MPLLRPNPTEIRIQTRAVPTRLNNQRSAVLLDGFLAGFIGILFDKYRLNILEVQPIATLSYYIKTLTTIKVNRGPAHFRFFKEWI